MAQHGTAWHNMAQHGTAWHSMAQHGTAWHSMAQHGIFGFCQHKKKTCLITDQFDQLHQI
jgi:hypothetical protein